MASPTAILWRFALLAGVPGLCHGVTTRRGGVSGGAHASLNLGLGSGDEAAAVGENRRRVLAALGLDTFVAPRQVHGRAVHRVDAGTRDVGDGDALVTNAAGVALAVIGADCPLVLLVDPRRRAIGVVHSGWRGTAAGVVPATLDAMEQEFGTHRPEVRVGIGPSISAPRYEVGPDVREVFARAEPDAGDAFSVDARGRLTLDVAGVILHQLDRAGVDPRHIERMDACTYGQADRWFSHRRDGPRTGRHALVAGWAPASAP